MVMVGFNCQSETEGEATEISGQMMGNNHTTLTERYVRCKDGVPIKTD